jgi:glycosyltransferase involved in cell wall biosynthesis
MGSATHVVIVPSWYPSHATDSAGIFFREQAIALTKAGLRVAVVAPLRISLKAALSHRPALEAWPGLAEVRRPYLGPPRAPRLDATIWRAIARRLFAQYVATHGRPDIVHAHSLYPAGEMALGLPAAKHIITEHSTAFLSDRAAELVGGCVDTLRRFDCRIAVSQHLATRLEHLAPKSGRWTYVPNLIDTELFAPSLVSGDRLRVLTVSNLTPSKRVDWVIRSFDRAFKSKDAELYIGGDGEERRALEALAARMPCADRIHFLGALSRSQVRDQMDRCSFFALASRFETFGVVLIEALSMGKPVLATDSGGPSSIVNERNGLLTPLHDEVAFAAGMTRMADMLHGYSVATIRADCVARFSEQAVTNRLIRIYDEALSLDRQAA